MLQNLFQREMIPVYDAALAFANQRQKTIMNNIANVDTPYYKRQTVPNQEFSQALASAMNERRASHPANFVMKDTKNINFFRNGTNPLVKVLPGNEAGPQRHDENSIVIEKEMSDLAKNTMMIAGMQKLLKKQYSMLRAALRDRIA